jgi:hypothetical protein
MNSFDRTNRVTHDLLTARATTAFNAVVALAEAIRELKEVPAGTLYAAVMKQFDIGAFNVAIETLVAAELIERGPNHMLRWTGEKLIQGVIR